MLSIVYASFVYLLEMPITWMFYHSIAEIRGRRYVSILLGLLIFESGAVINVYFGNTIWINFLYMFLLYLIFGLVCFRPKFTTAVLYAVILLIFCTALEFATIFIVSAIAKGGTKDYNSDLSLLIITTVICKSLYFIACILLMRFVRKRPVASNYPIGFYVYPLLTFICHIVFWYISINEPVSNFSRTLFALVSLLMFASSLFLFVVYRHKLEKDSEYLRVKSENDRLQTEKTYYSILERKNEELMIYAHDAKNHLSAIKNLNTDPHISSYIDKLNDQLKSYAGHCGSGNKTLDILINKYLTECEIRGLTFYCDIRENNLSSIDSTDLVAVLGNLMDNAITAAESSTAKHVSLETSYRNSYGVVIVTNSCDTPPISDGPHLLSTKDEPQLHGLGTKSVHKTLKKYAGDMYWEYDDKGHTFTATVMVAIKRK